MPSGMIISPIVSMSVSARIMPILYIGIFLCYMHWHEWCIFILAWALALSVSTLRAMREPRCVERTTTVHAFFMSVSSIMQLSLGQHRILRNVCTNRYGHTRNGQRPSLQRSYIRCPPRNSSFRHHFEAKFRNRGVHQKHPFPKYS